MSKARWKMCHCGRRLVTAVACTLKMHGSGTVRHSERGGLFSDSMDQTSQDGCRTKAGWTSCALCVVATTLSSDMPNRPTAVLSGVLGIPRPASPSVVKAFCCILQLKMEQGNLRWLAPLPESRDLKAIPGLPTPLCYDA